MLKKENEISNYNITKSSSKILLKDKISMKFIDIKIFLSCTNEYFLLPKFSYNAKVRDLKESLEFITGIPFNVQRLSYLDNGN